MESNDLINHHHRSNLSVRRRGPLLRWRAVSELRVWRRWGTPPYPHHLACYRVHTRLRFDAIRGRSNCVGTEAPSAARKVQNVGSRGDLENAMLASRLSLPSDHSVLTDPSRITLNVAQNQNVFGMRVTIKVARV